MVAFQYNSRKDIIEFNPHHPAYQLYDMNYVLAHELTHRMDELEYHSWENKTLKKAIEEAEKVIYIKRKEIQEWFEDGGKYKRSFAIADLINILSKGKIRTPVGHSEEYLKNEVNVVAECIANISAIEVLALPEKQELEILLTGLYEEYRKVVKI